MIRLPSESPICKCKPKILVVDDLEYNIIPVRFLLKHNFGIDIEDDLCGVIVKVRERRRVGYVPLCDVEVIDNNDPNYWSVREYVVWFANR